MAGPAHAAGRNSNGNGNGNGGSLMRSSVASSSTTAASSASSSFLSRLSAASASDGNGAAVDEETMARAVDRFFTLLEVRCKPVWCLRPYGNHIILDVLDRGRTTRVGSSHQARDSQPTDRDPHTRTQSRSGWPPLAPTPPNPNPHNRSPPSYSRWGGCPAPFGSGREGRRRGGRARRGIWRCRHG